jgi:hypothetical protein
VSAVSGTFSIQDPPSLTVTAPAAGASLTLGALATARFVCMKGGCMQHRVRGWASRAADDDRISER